MSSTKILWQGEVLSIQPRIRLTRSFDQRSHTYLGYNVRLHGTLDDEPRDFTIALGKKAHEKHRIQIGDHLTGQGHPVAEPRLETADLYKISGLEIQSRSTETTPNPPPYHHLAPDLDTYRARGHRRLATRTYTTHCTTCIWGCEMAVEMIIDHWNPSNVRYRRETFCYGPKSCRLYKPGPTRKVPGRKGMSWEEEDWVDEEATAHRGNDE